MLRSIISLVVLVTSTLAQDFYTYRLPNNTRPETYNLSLRTWIHEENGTFTGSVRIGIVAVESTDFIRLHHNVERLESVRVLSFDEVPITIGDYSYNAEFDFLTIPVNGNNLTQGTRYLIDIDYVGAMNTYSGFYRSFYFVGEERIWFASTKFEATNARQAFPCYDEPALEATFTIQITHDSSYTALSNMPAITESPQNPDGSITTFFGITPPMSTFLVGFHVSEFPHITSTPPKPIPQRIFSRSTAINSTKLGLEAGELLIETLSGFIGIEYKMPKMDQISVPNYPTGAGQNWGMITYDDFYILYNETVDIFNRHLYAVKLISHQMSHMWFGNLVTPSWWTYLWLAEGFSRLFEYIGVDLAYPYWQMMDYFVVDITHRVFYIDSNEFVQPMTHYVEHPTDIDFQFDRIVSNKAAAVLRMFWYAFGETVFMRGVTSYLQRGITPSILKLFVFSSVTFSAFSSAGEEKLFEALQISLWLEPDTILPPTENVETVMATWTRQPGFPLITVERNYDSETERVILRQERFYSFPPTNRQNTTWWVPYTLATPSNPGFENTRVEGWIPQNSSAWDITVDSLDADDYLLLNKRAAGYYRVLYDERNYRLIADAIIRNSSLFHTTNIAQLIQDAIEFYETGRLNLTTVLDLLRVLEFESNYIAWRPAFEIIFYINNYFTGHRNYPIWADFVRSLTEELYDAVGAEDIPGEPILRKFARENAVLLACQMGSVHCRSDTTRLLRRHIETDEEFHINIRQVLMCASMRSASRTDFHIMWNRLQAMPREDFISRSEIIEILGCSTSRPLLNEYVSSVFNLSIYNDFEQYSVINSVLQNGGNTGLEVVLHFFIENAIQTVQVFVPWFSQDLAYVIGNDEHIQLFIEYQNILIDAGLFSPELFEFNMQLVDNNVSWLNTQGEVISDWLLENYT